MAGSDRWAKLYEKVGKEKHQRSESDEREAAVSQSQALQEKRAADVAAKAMKKIRDLAVTRGKELENQAGGAVMVTFPARAPNEQVAHIAPEMEFLKLSLDRVSVYLYSARSPGKLPGLHVLSAVEVIRPSKTRVGKESIVPSRDRVASKMIGRIVPLDGRGDYELRAQSNGSGAVLDEDAVVFEAFDVLVKLWRQSKKPG
jgi:hypothetical protein